MKIALNSSFVCLLIWSAFALFDLRQNFLQQTPRAPSSFSHEQIAKPGGGFGELVRWPVGLIPKKLPVWIRSVGFHPQQGIWSRSDPQPTHELLRWWFSKGLWKGDHQSNSKTLSARSSLCMLDLTERMIWCPSLSVSKSRERPGLSKPCSGHHES